MDIKKLKAVLENPELEEEFQEVFSFVATITNQHFNISNLTPQNIEAWNQKFDEVLKQLLAKELS